LLALSNVMGGADDADALWQVTRQGNLVSCLQICRCHMTPLRQDRMFCGEPQVAMATQMEAEQRLLMRADHASDDAADPAFGRQHLIQQSHVLNELLRAIR